MLTSNVIALTFFLVGSNQIDTKHGLFAIISMALFTLAICFLSLDQSYIHWSTFLVCDIGGVIFGIYLLTKIK